MNVNFGGDCPGRSLSSIVKPAQTVLVGDSKEFRLVPNETYTTYGTVDRSPQYRHLETTNILFADGHVKSMKKDALELKAATEDGETLTGNDQFILWNLK